jgi:hypothetical protein
MATFFMNMIIWICVFMGSGYCPELVHDVWFVTKIVNTSVCISDSLLHPGMTLRCSALSTSGSFYSFSTPAREALQLASDQSLRNLRYPATGSRFDAPCARVHS